MSENLKCLKAKNEEVKKQSNKGNDTSKSELLEKTPSICMPSNKKKIDIGKLLPFNIQGNKTELLANSIGRLVENAANNSDRVIDAFGGTGAYLHYLRDNGNNKPMLLNEFDPYRFVTHKQLRDNPFGVYISADYYMNKLKNMVDQFKDGEKFGPDAEATQKEIVSLLQKEAERLIEQGQNITESYKRKSQVKMKNTPVLAGLYLVMQNQKFGYRSIQADASREGLKKVMTHHEIRTIIKERGKVRLFRLGRSILFDPKQRIYAVSKRMRNVDLFFRDGWELIKESAGDGDFVPVDTSYLGKTTSNYNKMTQEDCNHDIYMDKVHKYLMPAADRGAKLLITNNWDDEVVGNFQKLGFSVFKANRKRGVSRDTSELVAINFDPDTGTIKKGRKVSSIESSVKIKDAD